MGAHIDVTFIRQPFQTHETREAASAVAALRNLAAVGVKNTVMKIQLRIVRRFDDQQLVEAYAAVAIRQTAD